MQSGHILYNLCEGLGQQDFLRGVNRGSVSGEAIYCVLTRGLPKGDCFKTSLLYRVSKWKFLKRPSTSCYHRHTPRSSPKPILVVFIINRPNELAITDRTCFRLPSVHACIEIINLCLSSDFHHQACSIERRNFKDQPPKVSADVRQSAATVFAQCLNTLAPANPGVTCPS